VECSFVSAAAMVDELQALLIGFVGQPEIVDYQLGHLVALRCGLVQLGPIGMVDLADVYQPHVQQELHQRLVIAPDGFLKDCTRLLRLV